MIKRRQLLQISAGLLISQALGLRAEASASPTLRLIQRAQQHHGARDREREPEHQPRAGAPAPEVRQARALSLVDISNNLGDSKSLTTHPATTTHRRLAPEARAAVGITDGTIRVSIGLEDVRDLIADLDTALAAADAVTRSRAC